MKKLFLLTKTLLVAVMLLAGTNAWGAEEQTVLNPTGGVTTVDTGSSTAAYSAQATTWTINQGSVTGGSIGKTAGPYCLVKFDASGITGNITGATLSFDYASAANNTSYDVYLLGAADWNATTVVWSTLSSSAKSATRIAYGTWSTKNTTGTINYDITSSVSKSVMGMAICCNTARAQVISNIKLTITYTTGTVYTATFTDNTTSTDVTSSTTIYTDAGRTSSIINGALEDGTTYYYRATQEGYQNYEGSFTVSAADPAVSFSMTLKPRYTFKVNAVSGGATVKTLYTDDDSYDGKKHTVRFSKYLTGEGNVVTHSKDNDTYETIYTSASATATQEVAYTAYSGTAWFIEGESLSGHQQVGAHGNYSSGYAMRMKVENEAIMTIPTAGIYNIDYAVCNNNVNNTVSYALLKNTDAIKEEEFKSISVNQIKTSGTKSVDDVTFAASDVLNFYASATNVILDYVLVTLVRPATVSKTIGSYGYATFSSKYAVDCSSLPSGLKAYKATSCDGTTVHMEEVTTAVPANTGLVLKGDAGTYNIPTAATADAVDGNLLVNCDGSWTTLNVATVGTNYVLSVQEINEVETVVWAPVTDNNNLPTMSAGQAYLYVPANGARSLRMVFDGDVITGVTNVETAEAAEKDGKFIINGQLVIKKNGKKFNANGTQIK